ncbi:MAG: elongation factor G [Candidatus Latescibacteria bacterium]|nr:elongation factor G [Candidatus Latescibacterota bacterium]
MAYNTAQVRNVALTGHSGAGKTALAEAMLFAAGQLKRLGRVEDGTTVSDYTKEEVERKISLTATVLNCQWNGHLLNILDAPGYADFFGETQSVLRAVDAAVVVVDAPSGAQIGTERAWGLAQEAKLPRLVFANKLDHTDLDLEELQAQLKDRLGRQVVPLQLPVNPGPGFNQLIDLVQMRLFTYANGASEQGAVPAQFEARANELHQQLVEAVAETDEMLMEKYFSEGELTPEELAAGLSRAVVQAQLFPLCFGDAYNSVGADRLLDTLVQYCPSPEEAVSLQVVQDGSVVQLEAKAEAPLVAFVFKTVGEQHVGELTLLRLFAGRLKPGDEVINSAKNATERIGQIFQLNGHGRTEVTEAKAGDIVALVKLKDTHTGNTLCGKGKAVVLPVVGFSEPLIRVAVSAKEKGGEDRLALGMARLHEEDPSFVFRFDGEVHQSLLLTQGDIHLSTLLQRLKARFGVEVNIEAPKIPYRETIKGRAEGHYRHKKQSGGRGQFGEVSLRIAPKARGEGFEFIDEVVGGAIPHNFIPAVEKGLLESLGEGPLSACQVVDVAVTLYDGKYHDVDSDEVSFKIAASLAFKDAFLKAKPILLEPIYSLSITVPEEYMGDVMGDLSARRGRISGMDTEEHHQIIHAEAPLAEIDRYATALRSMTQGRGMHAQKFERYEEVPAAIVDRVLAETKRPAA